MQKLMMLLHQLKKICLPINSKKYRNTILKKEERDTIWEKFIGLNEQCKIISFIVDEAFVSDIPIGRKLLINSRRISLDSVDVI